MNQKKDISQKGIVVWLFGLSGAGKTTISSLLKEKLENDGYNAVALDGDVLRQGINKDLSFSEADRQENLRRTAEIAKIMLSNNMVTICSFITPLEKNRTMVSNIIGEGYFEVFVDCSLNICSKRDVKGLYKKAKANQITDFTGIGSSFEEPEKPNLVISTVHESPYESMEKIYSAIAPRITLLMPEREDILSMR
ncbi:adenylyl-sulfate kinase [uncultured Mucilaginibacter sp.]|uniref:adenylyl-sulfate kinase n=1 Tax=uncultured Mucilaginibacter sp. TaxID=797541 RepID=UPI0025DDB22D|nr:adenylyl-sulfate kinase [uncultured Mucilaginibacter sp.]